MEFIFWLSAAALTLLALFIITPPLWRNKNQAKKINIDQHNIDIAKDKLAELSTQLNAQYITIEEYNLQRTELEHILGDDLSLSNNVAPSPSRQSRWVIYLIILTIPTSAFFLYRSLGNATALLEKPPIQIAQPTVHKKQLNSVDAMLNGLVSRLKNQPDDHKGWLLLGKSYTYLGNTQQASDAFSKAHKLKQNTPDIMLHYANALQTLNSGVFDQQSKQLALKALKISPNDGMALWLAGLIKMQENDSKTALTLWQQAESTLDPKSTYYKKLKQKLKTFSAAQNTSAPRTIDNQHWIDLGTTYKSDKQYQQAIDAFSKSDLINSQQAPAMLLYADALVMQANGHYSEQANSLIFKALTISPNNTTALWLAGKSKAQDGAFNQALEYLNKAKSTLPPSSKSHSFLNAYIKGILTRENNSTVTTTLPAATRIDNQGAPSIIVQIKLDHNLQSRTHPDDTLFIYANALSGPQMPIAIVRKQVKDLPLQAVLTDAQAMTATMKLSNFKHVNVTARISKSGNALRQIGDLFGTTRSVQVTNTKNISITINQLITSN